MPRKQLRNMIIGTDLTTENPLIDSDKESESAEPQSPEPMAIEGPKTVDQETSLKIISGAPCEDLYNGNPVTLGDVTGKIIGAFDLPKKTRTIEDKAYTISYLNYGSYGSFAPVYDSRGASISKEDSEILFYDRKDPYFEELDKIANSDETSVTEYLARSLLGDEKAKESFDVIDPDVPPNPKDLETLSELGIDTSFLEAFTEDGQEKVKSESLPDIMEQLSIIIPKLLAQQNSRLLSNSDRGKIKDEELAVAEKVQAYLAKALKLTAPGAACSVDAVRNAMGVQI